MFYALSLVKFNVTSAKKDNFSPPVERYISKRNSPIGINLQLSIISHENICMSSSHRTKPKFGSHTDRETFFKNNSFMFRISQRV